MSSQIGELIQRVRTVLRNARGGSIDIEAFRAVSNFSHYLSRETEDAAVRAGLRQMEQLAYQLYGRVLSPEAAKETQDLIEAELDGIERILSGTGS